MKLRLGLVGDIHWSHSPIEDASWHAPFDVAGAFNRLCLATREFKRSECDVLVCVGDITHRRDSESLRQVLALWAREWDRPLVLAPGNHDHDDLLEIAVQQVADRRTVTARTERVLLSAGEPPTGRFERDIGEWPSGLAVVVSHYPLLSCEEFFDGSGFLYAGDLRNREVLERSLSMRRSPTLVLCGHLHARSTVATSSLLQLAVASLVEPPFECAIVDVETHASSMIRVARRIEMFGDASSTEKWPVFSPAQEEWLYFGDVWRRL